MSGKVLQSAQCAVFVGSSSPPVHIGVETGRHGLDERNRRRATTVIVVAFKRVKRIGRIERVACANAWWSWSAAELDEKRPLVVQASKRLHWTSDACHHHPISILSESGTTWVHLSLFLLKIVYRFIWEAYAAL